MNQLIRKQPRTANRKLERVAGLDLGARYSHSYVLTGDGELVEEGRLQSTEASLRKQCANEPRMRIALEAGRHIFCSRPASSQLETEIGKTPSL